MGWLPFRHISLPSRRRGDAVSPYGPSRSRLWLPCLALGLVGLLLLELLTYRSPQWDFVFLCTSMLSLVILFGACLTMPRDARAVWWSLWAFGAVTLFAQAVTDQEAQGSARIVEYPWAGDALFLVSYLPAYFALSLLIVRLAPGRGPAAWIDSSILSVAAISVFSLFLIVPAVTASDATGVVALSTNLFPALDLVLFCGLIWILVGGGRPRPSLALVTTSFTLILVAAVARDVSLVTQEPALTMVWTDVLRIGALVVLAAAATSTSAEVIATPRERSEPRVTTPRLAVLAVGVLSVPTLVAIRLWRLDERVTLLLSLAAMIVIILAVWRIKILVSTVEHQRQVTELVLDSAGDGIIGLDRQGFVLFANLSARRMLRCRESDLIGRRFHDVAHHEHPDGTPYPWHECPVRKLVLQGGEAFLPDQVYVRRDGTTFPVEIVMSPLVVEGSLVGAVQSFRDMSEREAVEELKRQFISVVSHELRTPLTSIKGSLKMLDSGIVGPLSEDQQELLTMAVNNSDRLGQLVNDILDLERLDSGRMPLEPEPASAMSLTQQAAAGMTGAADAAGIQLIVDGPDDTTEPDVEVDPHRMVQVLTNLVGNAIKFSERGSSIRLSVTRADEFVRIAVADRGRGIPADQLATVFDRFGQVDAGDARREGGTGLGLAISREIVTRSGGQIEVASALGQGSTFTVVLPAVHDSEAISESVP